jgi:drug/metabolite transporter (DMT)-like permease
MEPRLLAVAALLLNAATWGLSWWPFRHLHALGLHPLWVTSIVFALAALVIGLWRPAAWGQLARSPALWVILLASGCTNAAFNWAVTVGEVTRVVLLFYLMPLWTVVLARLLLHERLTPRVLLRVLLALAGAVLVLSAAPQAGADAAAVALDGAPRAAPWLARLADVLGVLGGMAFALNNVMLRREAHQPEEGRALAMFAGGAAVAGLVALGSAGGVPGLGAAQIGWPPGWVGAWWWPTLALALAFLVSNLALQYGAARLPANITAVVMPVEVLIASTSAVWLGGEVIPATLWIGGALILGATAQAALSER